VERISVELGKEWLSVADICEYMNVSTFVVTRVLRSGELPAVKFGREWRVARGDFEEWLNSQRLTGSAGVRPSASRESGRETTGATGSQAIADIGSV
jgi:excisionase family DNA binding protein